MKTRIMLLCGIGLVLLFAGACGIRVRNGSGNVVSESREVSDFTAVNFTGIGEMTITQGDEESLTIETDDNLLEYIETKVSRGVLTIGIRDDNRMPILRPTDSIRFELTVRTLDSLSLSGAGTLEAQALTADQLELVNSGAGEVSIAQLTADSLTVNLSGAGRIQLAGEVTEQTVTLSGLGTYEAGDLASQIASVTLSGAGEATVWAIEQLDAEISGAGAINYYGSPQVNATTSGIGNIEQLGDK